jgi:hypothetical protein
MLCWSAISEINIGSDGSDCARAVRARSAYFAFWDIITQPLERLIAAAG